MAASQAWGVLGRGACPHVSAHTASLLMLDLLKHLKGDAFVGGKKPSLAWQVSVESSRLLVARPLHCMP